MIAMAIDTAFTIARALLAWLAVAVTVVTISLLAAATTGAWAWRAAWRGVAAALSAAQHSGAPELPREPHGAPEGPSRPACSWAQTDKEAA